MLRVLANTLVLGLSLSAVSMPAIADDAAVLNKEGVEKIIAEYLDQHPEVVIEAAIKYRQQEMEEMQTKATEAVAQNVNEIFSEKALVVAHPEAPIKIVEFIDYQCGHCREMTPILEAIAEKHDDVSVQVKEFPIFNRSDLAAKAAIAADMQGQFSAFHKALMTSTEPITSMDTLVAIATKLELDVAQLRKDMNSKEVEKVIADTVKLGRDKLSLSGTPALIIGDGTAENVVFMPGATDLEKLTELVNQVRDNHK